MVNYSIRFLFERHENRLHPLKKTAGHIRARLEEIDSVYKKLCAATCPFCPDPCCFSADIWFDLKDLLFLHASGLAMPIKDPGKKKNSPCSFLSSNGCTIARTSRPWLCTWYLCPTQKRRLETKQPGFLHRLQKLTAEITALRKHLEQCFIELTGTE
ncbi:MAG: hypothetical protein KGY38_04910 [Desulfobacterales bacterium]|nr:hypothetical protein [Desulfobacterales bacterium]